MPICSCTESAATKTVLCQFLSLILFILFSHICLIRYITQIAKGFFRGLVGFSLENQDFPTPFDGIFSFSPKLNWWGPRSLNFASADAQMGHATISISSLKVSYVFIVAPLTIQLLFANKENIGCCNMRCQLF